MAPLVICLICSQTISDVQAAAEHAIAHYQGKEKLGQGQSVARTAREHRTSRNVVRRLRRDMEGE